MPTVMVYNPENVKRAILGRAKTLREVAERAKMEEPSLNRIVNGAIPDPRVKTLDRIARAVPCPVGEFFGEKPQGEGREVVVAFPRTQAERDRLAHDERPEQFEAIPLLENPASLGPGLEIEDAKLDGYCLIYRASLDRGGKHYAIKVSGSSMAPTLADGSIVAVNVNARDHTKLKGKIVAARVGDGVTVKQFRARGDLWYFAALNPDWEQEHGQIIVKPKDSIILGKVVWAWTRFA